MTQISIQRGRFEDCDEWCQMAEGWNLRFQQLDKGPLEAEMLRVLMPGLVVQEVSMSRRFHQSGIAPGGLLTFGLPAKPHQHYRQGRELTSSSIINFNCSDGYDSVTEPHFHHHRHFATDFLDQYIELGILAWVFGVKASSRISMQNENTR